MCVSLDKYSGFQLIGHFWDREESGLLTKMADLPGKKKKEKKNVIGTGENWPINRNPL